MFFSFTDKEIADVIAKKAHSGIEVKGVLEKRRISMKYNKYYYLASKHIQVKPDKNKYIMHHKVIIIDNTTLITGSYNPTYSASSKNYENIVIIKSSYLAEQYLNEFKRLYYAPPTTIEHN